MTSRRTVFYVDTYCHITQYSKIFNSIKDLCSSGVGLHIQVTTHRASTTLTAGASGYSLQLPSKRRCVIGRQDAAAKSSRPSGRAANNEETDYNQWWGCNRRGPPNSSDCATFHMFRQALWSLIGQKRKKPFAASTQSKNWGYCRHPKRTQEVFELGERSVVRGWGLGNLSSPDGTTLETQNSRLAEPGGQRKRWMTPERPIPFSRSKNLAAGWKKLASATKVWKKGPRSKIECAC